VPMTSLLATVPMATAALLLAAVGARGQAGVAPPGPAEAPVDFHGQIAPIFRANCLRCHGPRKQRNGLRLDRRADALEGGDSGPAIVPGSSDASRLVRMVEGGPDDRMPPEGQPLRREEIALLRAWIDQGAPWPEGDAAALGGPVAFGEDASTHWSFRPIRRPALPAVTQREWVRNPIDAFVLARLEGEGIRPSAEASRATLLRRASLDLVGLPPTPEELAAFLADDRPDAYEHAVDGLLASPHFGERWALPWLDLARYADSDGYEADRIRPHAWRYRHWLIRALDEDMPFDRFTTEQIAGDLLPDATVSERVATGFQRNTLTNREGGTDIEQFRFEQVVDRTNTVGSVWLGLTVGCAQCHDHKFDDITQEDYYSLFAYFASADERDIEAPLPGELGPYLAARPDYDRRYAELLAEYGVPGLQPAWEAKMKLAAGNPGKWTDWDHAFDAFQKYLDHSYEILLTPVSERTRRDTLALEEHFIHNYHRVITAERREELKFDELEEKLAALDAGFPDLSLAQALVERADPRPAHVHRRGEFDKLGAPVGRRTPALLPSLEGARPDRLGLAAWLVSRQNPLTARVAVNRVWQELFGAGLVRTPDDFGVRGEPPTHPELLDWLAEEFRSDWRLKRLIRLIVTSATYRQSSAARPETAGRDPENRLLARQNRLRLPAELIRDSALMASGLLATAIGGPSIRPPQPAGHTDLVIGNKAKWEESRGPDRYRRGLYIHFQRSVPYPFLMNFDAPERSVTACRRDRSRTPLQALNLLNDPVFFEAAQALAVRILTGGRDGFDERLERAFRLVLGREPSGAEAQRLRAYYDGEVAAADADTATRWLPVALPGVAPPEAAAWVGVGSVMLNLDEFLTRE